MGVYELLWGVGVLVLLGGLAWGVSRYHSRNRANDRITEQATRELYKDPEGYERKRPDLQRQVRRN